MFYFRLLSLSLQCLTFSSLQKNGVEKIFPVGPISAEEQKLLDAALPELKKNIEKGKAFAAQ